MTELSKLLKFSPHSTLLHHSLTQKLSDFLCVLADNNKLAILSSKHKYTCLHMHVVEHPYSFKVTSPVQVDRPYPSSPCLLLFYGIQYSRNAKGCVHINACAPFVCILVQSAPLVCVGLEPAPPEGSLHQEYGRAWGQELHGVGRDRNTCH